MRRSTSAATLCLNDHKAQTESSTWQSPARPTRTRGSTMTTNHDDGSRELNPQRASSAGETPGPRLDRRAIHATFHRSPAECRRCSVPGAAPRSRLSGPSHRPSSEGAVEFGRPHRTRWEPAPRPTAAPRKNIGDLTTARAKPHPLERPQHRLARLPSKVISGCSNSPLWSQ